MQDEVNQEDSEQNEVDGIKKGAQHEVSFTFNKSFKTYVSICLSPLRRRRGLQRNIVIIIIQLQGSQQYVQESMTFLTT